jgi:uncharacterized protein YukE
MQEEYILVPKSQLLQLKQDYEKYQKLLEQITDEIKIQK